MPLNFTSLFLFSSISMWLGQPYYYVTETLWTHRDPPLGKLAWVTAPYTISLRYSGFPRSIQTNLNVEDCNLLTTLFVMLPTITVHLLILIWTFLWMLIINLFWRLLSFLYLAQLVSNCFHSYFSQQKLLYPPV